MKPIQVGLLGIGTVGGGTFKVLQRNQAEILRRAGRGIQITMVADLDVARARAIVGPEVTVVADARQVIANAIQAGGYPPLYINPVDFAALYRDKRAELMKAQAEGKLDAGGAVN